jgi:hypothetical protein
MPERRFWNEVRLFIAWEFIGLALHVIPKPEKIELMKAIHPLLKKEIECAD